MRYSQVGQTLARDGSTLLSRVQPLLVIWAPAGVGQNTDFLKGYELLDTEALSLLSMATPLSKVDTYCCKSPVPNSGGHIQKVLSFHLGVSEPAGDITTGSSSAVLSGWDQGRRREAVSMSFKK